MQRYPLGLFRKQRADFSNELHVHAVIAKRHRMILWGNKVQTNDARIGLDQFVGEYRLHVYLLRIPSSEHLG